LTGGSNKKGVFREKWDQKRVVVKKFKNHGGVRTRNLTKKGGQTHQSLVETSGKTGNMKRLTEAIKRKEQGVNEKGGRGKMEKKGGFGKSNILVMVMRARYQKKSRGQQFI